MNIRKLLTWVVPFTALLLFSVLLTPFIRDNHVSSSMLAMMSKSKTISCVTACTSNRSSAQVNGLQPNLEEKEQEPAPEPANPYYLAFMGVGWTTVITVALAYLIKYLRWRPPDFFSLYNYYRI
jgi:hypothetical protein